MKSEIGQRGKVAEKLVQKQMEAYNGKVLNFAFSRLPDARAAGGRMAAALCDYLCWYDGRSIPLEVKETKHSFRLSKDALSQLSNMHKVAGAGAFPVVLVYHTELKQWRVAPISCFGFGVPSWDMGSLPLYDTVKDALHSTGLFP